MIDDDDYRWRETYFVYFDAHRRPTLAQLQAALKAVNKRFQFSHPATDDGGHVESLTVVSPADYAALDISYLEGDEAEEQGAILADEMKSGITDRDERRKVERIARSTARFDIMHFEQVIDGDEGDEMFDPSALLLVIEALSELTGGVGVDPQSGTLVG
ncbi:MAG: hypothetical protein K2Y37_02240 [Pirellulales bacterium]|nr:hypothetical protein [Pirellulales bacterium]